MAFLGRLILRLIVVPLAAALAALGATVAAFAVSWNQFLAMIDASPDSPIFADLVVGTLMAFVFSVRTVTMLMPAAIGVLASEIFVIRSWIFHVLNGAVSIWVGWWTGTQGQQREFFDNPLIVVAVGLVAGFIYWAVAGWNAGLFKSASAEPPPPAPATPR